MGKVILSHFGRRPLEFNAGRKYHPVNNFKPLGLWLSDEKDHGWAAWCRGEDWNLDGLKHESKFICDTSRWAVLDSAFKIVEFTEKYHLVKYGFYSEIDWRRVEKKFAGILISPYQWSLRMDDRVHWYYGWDCASGCVWDLTTVERIEAPRIEGAIPTAAISASHG